MVERGRVQLVQTSVRLPAPILTQVDELAEREQRNRANMIIVLLHEALEARKRAAEGHR